MEVTLNVVNMVIGHEVRLQVLVLHKLLGFS